MTELIIASIMTIMTAATPLIFAATGELICEKSGVLNPVSYTHLTLPTSDLV